MKYPALTLILLLITALGIPAEELKPQMTDPRIPNLVDSTIAPIPGNDSLKIEHEQVSDSIQQSPMLTSTQVDSTNDTLTPVESGFVFGARWGFTTSDIFNDWVNHQKSYKAQADESLKDMGYKIQSRWLQEPETQSICFPFTLGYFHRIDSVKSVTSGASYSFRRQRSVFQIEEDSTENLLFESSSRLSHHQIELFSSFQYCFNPEYFSLTGVDATGIDMGGGIIPLSCFVLKSESTNEFMKREVPAFGAGVSWQLGVFAEKQITQNFMTRFFFNYHGSYHWGFKNHDELFSLDPVNTWDESTLTFVENFFELGFLFTIQNSKE